MKTTVGGLFKLLQLAEANRRGEAERHNHENYGQALSTCAIISQILENCDLPIETDATADSTLVPFATKMITDIAQVG